MGSRINTQQWSTIFVKPKKIEFKVKDVEVPDIPGMFTTFKANSVPLFVEGSQFNDITHFGKIMGYDKPLDLMWDRELDMTKSEAEAKRKKIRMHVSEYQSMSEISHLDFLNLPIEMHQR